MCRTKPALTHLLMTVDTDLKTFIHSFTRLYRKLFRIFCLLLCVNLKKIASLKDYSITVGLQLYKSTNFIIINITVLIFFYFLLVCCYCISYWDVCLFVNRVK